MYCRECGAEVRDNAEICPNCGVRPLNGNNHCQTCGATTRPEQEVCTNCGVRLAKKSEIKQDEATTLVKAASCCFPIVGLILYLVWHNEKPSSAKSACKWAIIGTVAVLISYVVGIALGILASSPRLL